MIPKNIFQIYHDKSLVPPIIKSRLLSLNQEYNYKFLDFQEGQDIILNNFKELDPNKIINTMNNMPRYCHRSDLLRYCLLYLYGGFYLDVDLELLTPLNTLCDKAHMLTSFGKGAEVFTYTLEDKKIRYAEKIMANGILGSVKNNPIILDLIKFCIDNPADASPDNRGIYIKFLYNYFNNECLKEKNIIKPFTQTKIKDQSVYLFDTTNTDKYGVNCIFDLNDGVIVNPNNQDYKIPRQTSSYL